MQTELRDSTSEPPRAVALIPARAGSRRLVNKNVRALAGHPVIAYTIRAAIDSGVFDKVFVSTDSEEYADIAQHYGAEVPFLRPADIAGELSPDIEWIEHALGFLRAIGGEFSAFSILRPTSPFRTPATIRRAWDQFCNTPGIDSLRAVEKCKQHPGKMWVVRGDYMLPLLPLAPVDRPWHSMQYQALPEVYVQNASLEIAWSRVVIEDRTIAGQVVTPFLTEGHEGFDINQLRDWQWAEQLFEQGEATLPTIDVPAYQPRLTGHRHWSCAAVA